MTVSQYLNEIVSTMPKIARETGHSTFRLYMCFLRCYIQAQASLDDFQGLKLYGLSPLGVGEMLTCRRIKRVMKKVNNGSTPEEFAVFNQKNLFNAAFGEYVHRDWLYLPVCGDEDIRRFLQQNDEFLLKPTDGQQGKGILHYFRQDVDTEDFIARYKGREFLMETFIRQHPSMAALNHSSVNTIRISTVRYQGRLLLLGAGLRCGGMGAHVDNFSIGGSAYPIDMDTGVVSAPGKQLGTTRDILHNPAGDRIMPGFRIPHWELVKAAVTKAAFRPEHIGYIAWDVAITEDGIEFVEGNANFPGSTIIQLNGGVYKKLRDFLKD